jgi:hypothetical protein
MLTIRPRLVLAISLALVACRGASEPRAGATAERTELKRTVRADQVDAARASFGLADESAKRLGVTFYDTPALELFASGLVLRSRAVEGGADDATVKIRPLAGSAVAEEWLRLDGFKCEEDRTGSQSVESCSLTAKQSARAIEAVARGESSVAVLFTERQLAFVKAYARAAPDWGRLKALGPIPSKTWELRLPELESKLSAELWTLPDGRALLEISTKVPRAESDRAAAALDAALRARGLSTSGADETKTRAALECFAGR